MTSRNIPEPTVMDRAATVMHTEAAAVPGLSYDEPLVGLSSTPFPEVPWWKRIAPTTVLALVTGAVAVLFLLQELIRAGALGFPLDDAWTHLVYTKNFFHSITFDFNLGEHTAGPTAPLWTVIEALSYPILKNPLLVAKLAGAIFLFITSYYAFRLLRKCEFDYGSALLGGIIVLLIPRLGWSELAGMEAPLSAALVLGGIWWHFSYHADGRKYLTGAIFALAALARPETIVLFLLLVAFEITRQLTMPKRVIVEKGRVHFWRDLLLALLAFIIILIPVSITDIFISGSIIPQSFRDNFSATALPVLIHDGEIGAALARLYMSLGSIYYAIVGIYAQDGPFYIISIIAASIALIRDEHLRKDRVVPLFLYGLTVLLFFPYLRSLYLGINRDFGEHARWVAFLSPVYVVTGLLSIKLVVKRYYMRGPSNRTILIATIASAVLIGLVVLLVGGNMYLPVNHPWSSHLIPIESQTQLFPSSSSLLLFAVYFAIASILALRWVESSVDKEKGKQYTHDPKENDGVILEIVHDDAPADEKLPKGMIRLLNVMLIVMLAWGFSTLPRAAKEYGVEVHGINSINQKVASYIAQTTMPTDVIATNSTGYIGWKSERKVLDTEGQITNDATVYKRKYGLNAGLLMFFASRHPSYFAAFGTEYQPVIDVGIKTGLFDIKTTFASTSTPGAQVLGINYAMMNAAMDSLKALSSR